MRGNDERSWWKKLMIRVVEMEWKGESVLVVLEAELRVVDYHYERNRWDENLGKSFSWQYTESFHFTDRFNRMHSRNNSCLTSRLWIEHTNFFFELAYFFKAFLVEALSVSPSVLPSIHMSFHSSVRPTVRPSVRPSVCPSVRPSFRHGIEIWAKKCYYSCVAAPAHPHTTNAVAYTALLVIV